MFLRSFRGVPWLVLLCLACSSEPPPQRDPDPEIVAFAADPAVIREGGQAKLRWRTNFATQVTIHEEGGVSVDLQGESPNAGEVEVSPAASTTYVLRASSRSGITVEATTRLEVVPANEIVARLWLEPETVPYGQQAILHWETQHANRVVIEAVTNGEGRVIVNTTNPTGTHEIVAQETVDFRLRAEGVLGIEEATARLLVSPAIDSFQADGITHPVFPGDPVEVAWAIRAADEVRVLGDEGVEYVAKKAELDRGKATLPAPTDGVFVLIATRQGVEARRELEIPIVGPPEFASVSLDPPAVTEGSGETPDVRLSWRTTNAKTLRIHSSAHGDLDLSGKGVLAGAVVVPAVPEGTVFTLVASNGREETEHVIEFEGVPLPVVSLRAVPQRVAPGDSVRLAWEAEHAVRLELYRHPGGGGGTRIRIPFDREVGMNDWFDVVVTGPTLYEIEAFNLAGDSTSAFAFVDQGQPEAQAWLEPRFALPGESVTFSWKSIGGVAVHVEDAEGDRLYSTTELFDVEEGSVDLPAPAEQGVHAFAVRVQNGFGDAVVPLELTVTTGPRVQSFHISPERIRAGREAEFAWRVLPDGLGRDVVVEIRDDLGNVLPIAGVNLLEASVGVAIEDVGERTYFLRTWAGDSFPTELSARLTVFGPPVLEAYVEPERFDPFDPEIPRLHWRTEWVSRVVVEEVDADGNVLRQVLDERRQTQVVEGSVQVMPQRTGSRFRVVAENPWGETIEDEFFVDYLLPTIDSFEVSATSITKGQSVTLSWSTQNGIVYLNGPLLLRPFEEIFGQPFVSIGGSSGTQNLTNLMMPCPTTTFGPTDEGCVTVDLPSGFVFPWAGRMVTQVRMGTNGWLGFDPSVPGPGDDLSSIEGRTYPTTTALWSQIIGYGADLWSSPTYQWRTDSDEKGPVAIFEWHTGSPDGGIRFQVALRPTGAFEIRFSNQVPSSTSTNAYSWGYQDFTGTVGLSPTPKPLPSQLGNRVFRYEPKVEPTGSLTFEPKEDTVVRLCVYGPDFQDAECESTLITVAP